MNVEWLRFFLTAVLLIFSLFCYASAVNGVWKFGFVMNRMHAAGIGDTLGLLSLILGLMISSGWNMVTLKLLLLVLFLWFSSPVSSHFLSQIEYYTNPDLYREVGREEPQPLERMDPGGGTAEDRENMNPAEETARNLDRDNSETIIQSP